MGSRLDAWSTRARALFSPRERLVGAERVAHWLAVAACVFFAAAAFWESFGAQRSGHFSTSAAYAMAGENMVHWRKFAIYSGYLAHPATPDQYYCHHPYGVVVLQAIAYVLFGHHWFTTRAAAIFCSVISPPLLYGFGRIAWGVIPAAVATIFFVFVPIDLSFAAFSNLEEPTIAFGLLFAWSTAKLFDGWKVRHLVLSAVGALGASNGDWVGLVFVGVAVGFGFVRAFVIPRSWYGRVDDRMAARWFAFATAMAVGTVVLYLALFAKADKVADLMGSYHLRSAGGDVAIKDTFTQRRKLWLAVMLTPLSFYAIGAGIPLACLRLVRRPLEIFAIAWACAASFQYFVFKQGADIHIFWPHYYGPTAAFGAGTVMATLLGGREAVVGWVESSGFGHELRRFVRVGSAAVLGTLAAVTLLALARVGILELVQSRKTNGRFDSAGKYQSTDADMAEFAKWSVENVATAGSTVQALEKYDFNFSNEYGVDRPYVRVPTLTVAKPEDPQRIALVDTRNQNVKDLENIAKQFGVQAVGPLWRVDRAQKGPSFVAEQYEEREPNAFEWLFVSGSDLVRKISRKEDPFTTWEWKDALGLPNTPPSVPPVTVDELRIAHNVAVADGDSARAEELRVRVAGHVGVPLGLTYTDGIRLQGVEVKEGPAIVVTLYWETDATFKKVDTVYQVKCKITQPPAFFATDTDYFEKDMAPVPIIRPVSWKPGYLYEQRFIALHRIGKEECSGVFTGDVHLADGKPNATLFTLP